MKRTLPINEERNDIQALLRTGFSRLRQCRFWLLTVDRPEPAKAWLRSLLEQGLVHTAGQIDAASASDRDLRESVVVAFSNAGLQCLGLVESSEFPFPTPFSSGMGSALRAGVLRDEQRDAWSWSDAPATTAVRPVHVLVVHYSQFPADITAAQTPFVPAFRAPTVADGISAINFESCPSYIQQAAASGEAISFEPFGFRDALAQPVVRDLREAGPPPLNAAAATGPADRLIAPGEFVLGHRNEYGELTYCPDVVGWSGSPANPRKELVRFGFNGSYLAVRQIEQFVKPFKALHMSTTPPAEPGMLSAPSLAEKMIGRRRDAVGTPLWWPKNSPSDFDDFRFRTADTPGFHCPRGAHIRRANPRDTLGHDVGSGIAASKLHRLLRRGRPFRRPDAACKQPDAPACGSDEARQAECGHGIFFVACNADLDRQFEFVQQRWIADSGFGDLSNQRDPLIGGGTGGSFSTPGAPSGKKEAGLGPYTQTVGGGYFFLPGLLALRFICA